MAEPGADEPGGPGSYYAALNVRRDATTDEIKRAYRQLASVFHPDKHARAELRAQAQEAFARLQEAYEVLSDPERRDVYDAYGKEGLAAGFALGTKLQSTEERRARWAAFLEEEERKRQDALANHRGHYLCRLDATALAKGERRAPAVRAIMASNAVDVPLDFGGGGGGRSGDAGVLTIQGQALLRSHPRLVGSMLGSGSVLAGYRRPFGDADTLDASVQVGLNGLASLTSTRQVDTYTHAALAATYAREQGLGLQVISTRQLWRQTTGEFRWVVGPAPGGVSLAVAHRANSWGATARVELAGGGGALQLRLSCDATAATQLRGVLRLTAAGPDLEVGAEHKFNAATSGYLGAQVGLRGGVVLRVRARRSRQTFEFPVLLSTDARDWQLFVAGALAPPLASLALHRLVVAPLVRWRRRAAARAAAAEHAEHLKAAHLKAAREAALLAPVAKRRAAAEAAAGGLIVLHAVYGDTAAWRAALAAGRPAAVGSGCAVAGAAPALWPPPLLEEPSEGGDAGLQQQQQQQQLAAAGAAAAAGGAPSLPSPAPAAAAQDGDEPPPLWVDVTAALQYLVANGALELHGGVSKRGLMGFADVLPPGAGDDGPGAAGGGEQRRLYVAFARGGALFEKEVGDADMLRLPAAGAAVRDAAAAERLRVRLGVMLAAVGSSSSGGGSDGGSGSGASSRRGSSVALSGGGGGASSGGGGGTSGGNGRRGWW